MARIYYIPNGPKNLASLFPTVDWNEVSEYFVAVMNTSDEVMASTVLNKICSCCDEDKVRLHFLNHLGTYDAINFPKPKIERESVSDQYRDGLTDPLDKEDTGMERFNVLSNETSEVKLKCQEKDLPWLMECADSPKAFIEWKGIEGQLDSYMPVVILDSKKVVLKNDLEFEYEFILSYKLSNEYSTIRN